MTINYNYAIKIPKRKYAQNDQDSLKRKTRNLNCKEVKILKEQLLYYKKKQRSILNRFTRKPSDLN